MPPRKLKEAPRTRCDDCATLGCPIRPRGCIERPEVAFVGEAGGGEEERQGLPFVGRSGKLLRQTAAAAGLDMGSIYYTNAVMWRPPENRDPKNYEVAACADRLLDELVAVRPRLIVPLGNVGTKALLKSDTGITKIRGVYREIEIDGHTFGVLPTLHPAAIFRQPDMFMCLYTDLVKAKEILGGRAPVVEPPYANYMVIDTQSMFEALIRRLFESRPTAIDIETTDLVPSRGEILCVGFSWKAGTAAILDWRALIEGNEDNLPLLNRALKNVPAAFQGGQFDNPWLWSRGVNPQWVFDTMTAHYATSEVQGTHGLKRQAIDRYYAPAYDDDLKQMLAAARKSGTIPGIPKKPRKGRVSALLADAEAETVKPTAKTEEDDRKSPLKIPIEAWGVPELRQKIMKYCGADVDYTIRLAEDLTLEMTQDDVLKVHDDILMPASRHFASLEYYGIKVDTQYHDQLGATWQGEIDEVSEKLFELSGSRAWPGTPTGRPWWAAWQRLAKYLYEDLKLRQMVSSRMDGKLSQSEVMEEIAWVDDEDAIDYWRTASSAVFSNMKPSSTNTYMLYWLGQQHDFPRQMVPWRILDKKLGTYYHGYRAIMREGGRIHPRYRVTGARTMRVSCTDPNIHGVARKKEIKRIFVADEGYTLLYSDYSQAEIRMLAHMSGDEQLRLACESEDIHFAVACDLFLMTPEQMRAVDSERREFMRRAAKTIAFGIIYGRMPESLAPQLGCTVEEATVYRERFLQRMLKASRWIAQQKAKGMREREVVNLYGGKRRFPIILDRGHQSEAERQMVNAPIQGSVSIMTLLANIKILSDLEKRGIDALPHAHIHDGFLLQVPTSKLPEALEVAKEVTHTPDFPTKVRFAVELATGPSWAELETAYKG